MTCPWTHRLWTLQEGLLPKTLLFQFADQAVDIGKTWTHHRQVAFEDVTLRSMAIDINKWCLTMRAPFHSGIPLTLDLNTPTLIQALGLHSVSVAAGETLCLGTLFSLDTKRLEETTEERRMAEFWKEMPHIPGGIPQNIIFNHFPRLQAAGFRWAPATFLGISKGPKQLLPMTSGSDMTEQGTVTPHGLLVKLPATSLRRMHLPQDLIPSDERRVFHLRHRNGQWHILSIDVLLDGYDKRDVLELVSLRKPILLTKRRFGTAEIGLRDQFALLAEDTDPGIGSSVGAPSSSSSSSSALSSSHPSSSLRILRSIAQMTLSSCKETEQYTWSMAYELAQRLQDINFQDHQITRPREVDDDAKIVNFEHSRY